MQKGYPVFEVRGANHNQAYFTTFKECGYSPVFWYNYGVNLNMISRGAGMVDRLVSKTSGA